jgi:hypothetical protein
MSRRLLLLLTLSLLLVPAAAARAAVIVGDDLSGNPISPGSEKRIVMSRTPDNILWGGSPISGVVTSVRVKTTGSAGSVKVIFEHLSGNLGATGTYVKTHPDLSIPVAADVASGGHITEVSTRSPIDAGDVLGEEDQLAATKAYHVFSAPGVDTCSYSTLTSPQNVGDTGFFFNNGCNQYWPALQVTVEPDADHDGYGDETQDLCPTDSTRQTVCLKPAALTISAVKSKAKAAATESRSFTLTNSGQVAAALVPFSIKSSKSVRKLKIVKGCKPAKSPRFCVIESIAPGASITIRVRLSIKHSTRTTLTAQSGILSANSKVKLKARKR